MKIIKYYIVAFSLISITLGLSCNKDLLETGMNSVKVPSQFIEVKGKVDRILQANKSIIPKGIDIHIMWETAVQVNNHVEVEILSLIHISEPTRPY
mgnify:CR=1 FL=1